MNGMWWKQTAGSSGIPEVGPSDYDRQKPASTNRVINDRELTACSARVGNLACRVRVAPWPRRPASTTNVARWRHAALSTRGSDVINPTRRRKRRWRLIVGVRPRWLIG